MSGFGIAALILIIGGLAPAAWLGSHGRPEERLVGLQIGSAVTVAVLMLIAEQSAQSSSLIVPLVLAVLSVPGVLVFSRLLAPQPGRGVDQ